MMRQKKPDLKEIRLRLSLLVRVESCESVRINSSQSTRARATSDAMAWHVPHPNSLGTGGRFSRSRGSVRRSSLGASRSATTAAVAATVATAIAAVATTVATTTTMATTVATAMATLTMMATTAAVGVAATVTSRRARAIAAAAATVMAEQTSRCRLLAAQQSQADDREKDRDPENKCAIHLESSYRYTGTYGSINFYNNCRPTACSQS